MATHKWLSQGRANQERGVGEHGQETAQTRCRGSAPQPESECPATTGIVALPGEAQSDRKGLSMNGKCLRLIGMCVALAVTALLLPAGVARADVPVPTDSTYHGILYAADGGLHYTPDGNPSPWSKSSIRYDVWDRSLTTAPAGVAVYTYQYTFSWGDGGSKDLSHMIISVSQSPVFVTSTTNGYSPGVNGWNFEYYDGTGWTDLGGVGAPASYKPTDGSNPEIPEPIFGLKLPPGVPSGLGEWSFRFESTRVPAWGSVYLKDGTTKVDGSGEWVTAHNEFFPEGDPSSNTPNWNSYIDTGSDPLALPATLYPIAGITGDSSANLWGRRLILTPDSEDAIVPEPSSAILAGLGLLGLLSRRKKRA